MHRAKPTRLLALAGLAIAGCSSSGDNEFEGPDVPPPGTGVPDISLEAAFPGLTFSSPVVLRQAPGDGSRWLVAEQQGVIRVFNNDVNATGSGVFLDLSDRVDAGPGEAGLLGFAFHPGYPSIREIYVSYTAAGAAGSVLTSRISRFAVENSGLTALPNSEDILLAVPQPNGNHNGGDLAFGPDGLLYAAFGDGGGAGDPGGNAQDSSNLLGTILRLDIDGGLPYAIPPGNPFAANPVCGSGPTGSDCPEIFAFGLRNPWRIGFDRMTGLLWAGDVGQGSFEEIDVIEAGGNYGWNQREGAHCFEPASGCDENFIDPVTEYGRELGQSVTGGYVYRGNRFPTMNGYYVFGDFVAGRIFAIPADSEPTVVPEVLLDTDLRISTFAEDVDGELYVVNYAAGSIHRIVVNN